MKLGIYDLANTRGVCPLKHRVRVSRNGELVAEVYPAQLDPDLKGHSDPLRFVRRFPQSRSRRAFVQQLQENNVPSDDITMLLQMAENN